MLGRAADHQGHDVRTSGAYSQAPIAPRHVPPVIVRHFPPPHSESREHGFSQIFEPVSAREMQQRPPEHAVPPWHP